MSILYLLITVNNNLTCSVWGDIAVDEHHYFSLGSNDKFNIIVRWNNNNFVGDGRRATLLQHLRQQLETKNMIYSKDQIQLSTTVGQGIVS